MDEKDKKAYREKLRHNKHELYVMSVEEFDKFVAAKTKATKRTGPQNTWDKFKKGLETGANFSGYGKDAVTLAKIFGDLGYAGTKAYVKFYRGKAHIIFKGQPGLRKIFTGTRYGAQNAKIVQMGLGKYGAIKAAKSGGVLTILLLTAYRVTNFILTDEATLNQLIGTLATDVVKIGIATGASIAAAAAAAALFSVAVGPLIAAIGVGILATYGLDKLDNHFRITERVIEALEELESGIDQVIENKKQAVRDAAAEVAGSVIDYAIKETRELAIDTLKHLFERVAPTWPR